MTIFNSYVSHYQRVSSISVGFPGEIYLFLSRTQQAGPVVGPSGPRLLSQVKRGWERTKSGLEFYSSGLQLLWQDGGEKTNGTGRGRGHRCMISMGKRMVEPG